VHINHLARKIKFSPKNLETRVLFVI